ncbi:7tm Odorant receptor [Popillia japonica]|uniref:Odorant receptor n=1 Tax=Popillia japonica TaxID=7064 RepID=A0AAW1M0B5_POPJA
MEKSSDWKGIITSSGGKEEESCTERKSWGPAEPHTAQPHTAHDNSQRKRTSSVKRSNARREKKRTTKIGFITTRYGMPRGLGIWRQQKERREITSIIKTLEIYGERYEPYEQFDVTKIIRKAKTYKDGFTLCFLLLALFTGISSSFSCLISVLRLQISKSEPIPLKLPYYSYMPFDYRSSKPAFIAGILYQFVAVIYYAFIIIGFDTLYTAILGYVSAQLDIIQGAFETIRPRCMVRLGLKLSQDVLKDPPALMDEMHKEMNKVVNHLQVLLNICRRLEEIFTNVILAQVMISLIVFCTCIFLVSNLPMMSFNFAAEMIYMIAIECQLLIYCVFGNKVTVSSSNISSSIYNGDWYSTSTSFKRSMLITMSRMQKPIYFTIGKFTPLTLSTFLTISRASYSFFAVLKNSDFSN